VLLIVFSLETNITLKNNSVKLGDQLCLTLCYKVSQNAIEKKSVPLHRIWRTSFTEVPEIAVEREKIL
jgi:hypothetical protein